MHLRILSLCVSIGVNKYQFNHQENTKAQEATNFSPEVHVLAGTLDLIVSTNTWWFGG